MEPDGLKPRAAQRQQIRFSLPSAWASWLLLVLFIAKGAWGAGASDGDSEASSEDRKLGRVQRFVAGQFGDLGVPTLQGLGSPLYRAGRVRFRPEGWECGAPGSAHMDDAVQPPCVGHVCKGPTTRYGDLGVWNNIRLVHIGVYQLCWCRPDVSCGGPTLGMPGDGCCLEDAAFNQSAGVVEVAGPAWVTISPVLGQSFRFELSGPEVWQGSLVLLRARNAEKRCGFGARKEDELRSNTARPAVPQDKGLPMGLSSSSPDRKFNISGEFGSEMYVASVHRRVAFSICWCAKSCFQPGTYDVIDEDAFSAEVGEFLPRGPETENIFPQYAVAGVRMTVSIQGNRLSVNDRIRIVDGSLHCGDEGAAHSVAFRSFMCGRGDSPCFVSPALGSPPTSMEELGGYGNVKVMKESWHPVEIDAPGTYRLCWCVDDTWDPVLLESHGHCGAGEQFVVDAGQLIIQGAFGHQPFPCTSFRSCRVEVFSQLPFDAEDMIMVVAPDPAQTNSLAMNCGRGTSGIQVLLAGTWATFPSSTTEKAVAASGMSGRGGGTDNESLDLASISTSSSTTTPLEPLHYVGEFQLPSAGQPGLYRVCYCKSKELGPCDDPAAFAQYAGYINTTGEISSMMGSKAAKACLALSPCNFEITGVWAMQINYFDRFRAIPWSMECGSSKESSSYPLFWMKEKLRLDSGAWVGKFVHKTGGEDLYLTGDYRLCFCHSSEVPEGECTRPEQFAHDIGNLSILGARIYTTWHCEQGGFCALEVAGWRMAPGDGVRLVEEWAACGQSDLEGRALAAGFDFNPAAGNSSESIIRGVMVKFNLGRSRGAGRWRVCLCVGATARSGSGCKEAYDYAQEVGELIISGLIRSVMVSSQPATAVVASLLVDVATPGSPRSLACAASNQTLAEAPSSWAIHTCEQNIPGCLGYTVLPWRPNEGWNSFHLPFALALNGSMAPAAPDAVPKAHVWCTGDVQLCPSGRCAMPPTGKGLEVERRPGTEPWREFEAQLAGQVDLEVKGDPLNAQGGWLHLAHEKDGCPKVGLLWQDAIPSAITLPRPFTVSVKRYVRWRLRKLPFAGKLSLCWCDRAYGADCVIWQHVGKLTIGGPSGVVDMPEALEASEMFNLTLEGVNLTSEDYISLLPGGGCSKKEGVSAEKVSDDGREAQFKLKAPEVLGAFVVCWTRGQNSSEEPVQLASGISRESRDCILGSWEPELLPSNASGLFGAEGISAKTGGELVACTRPCGGGLMKLRRHIVAEAMGGGAKCPEADSPERYRREPCNLHLCPGAAVARAWTEPAGPFEVDDSFQVLLQGTILNPAEDRVLLLRDGRNVKCGEAAMPSADATNSTRRLLNFSNVSGEGDAPSQRSNATATASSKGASFVHGGGASCYRPASNSTFLECGDGFMSLRISEPGIYRICLCDASAVVLTYVNESGSLIPNRERCSDVADYAVTPLNASLIEILDPEEQGSTPTEGEGTFLETIATGMQDLSEGVQKKHTDSMLVAGLVAAAMLYCMAVFCACWFWRYRWRKRGDHYNKSKSFAGTGIISNSLVAKATRAAWDAYARTIVEQAQMSSGDEGPEPLEVIDENSVAPERPASGGIRGNLTPPGTGLSRPASGSRGNLTPPGTGMSRPASGSRGNLTPPGTGMSLRSAGSNSTVNSTSTTSTRASTPGSRPSLLKVQLNQDTSRPRTPKQGGSFLDMTLTGRGAGATPKPTFSRPNTGASSSSYERVEQQSASSASGKEATPPASDAGSSEPPTPPPEEAETPSRPATALFTQPSAPSNVPPQLQLPGLSQKLAKLARLKEREVESDEEETEEAPNVLDGREKEDTPKVPEEEPVKNLVPMPPTVAPPALPGQLDASPASPPARKPPPSKDPQHTPRQAPPDEPQQETATPRITPREVPTAPAKQPPSHAMLRPLPPPPPPPGVPCAVKRPDDDKAVEEDVKRVKEEVKEDKLAEQEAEKTEVKQTSSKEMKEDEDSKGHLQMRETRVLEEEMKLKAEEEIKEDVAQNVEGEEKEQVMKTTEAEEVPDVDKVTSQKPVEEEEKKETIETTSPKSSGPRLNSWLGDMRSRMVKKPEESKASEKARSSGLGLRGGLKSRIQGSGMLSSKTVTPAAEKEAAPLQKISEPAASAPDPAPLPPEPAAAAAPDDAPPRTSETLEAAPVTEEPRATDVLPEPADDALLPPSAAEREAPPSEVEPAPLLPAAVQEPLPQKPAMSELQLPPIQEDYEPPAKAIKPTSPEVTPRNLSLWQSMAKGTSEAQKEADDDMEIVRCHTPGARRPSRPPPGPPPLSSDLQEAWAKPESPMSAQPSPKVRAEEAEPEADSEAEDLGFSRGLSRRSPTGGLPTGSWQDSQEQLRQEWYERLAAGVDANEKPRRGASLRGAASKSSLRRPGASLRGAATSSASGSVVGSMAPSRASQSPENSPRHHEEDADGLGPGPSLGAPSGGSRRGAGPGLGPLPGAGPGPGLGAGPGRGFGPGPGPMPGFAPGFGPAPPGFAPGPAGPAGPGPSLGRAPGRSGMPAMPGLPGMPGQPGQQTPNWAFCAP